MEPPVLQSGLGRETELEGVWMEKGVRQAKTDFEMLTGALGMC